MVRRSFSISYALRTVYRRKIRNIYAILGITLGVSLLLGVQVSKASTEAGWQYFFVRTLGDFEAQLIPIEESYFNESAAWDLNRATKDMESIEAISGRLSLGATAFQPATGRIELGVQLLGIPLNESGFGEFLDRDTGNRIDLNQSFIIGENIAEELNIGKNDSITLIFAEGTFSFQIEKTVDYVYKDEDRGRENGAASMVMQLDALQPLVANHSGYTKPINVILINFDKSVNSEDEAEEALNEVKNIARDLFESEDLRESKIPLSNASSFNLSKFPQTAEVKIFQFLDEDISTQNWTSTNVALIQGNGITNLTNTGDSGTGSIEYSGLALNTSALGQLLIRCKGDATGTFRIVANSNDENDEILVDNNPDEFHVYCIELNSSYLLNSITISPVESNTKLSIDYIGIGQSLTQNTTATCGSELFRVDQFVVNVDEKQIELSDNWYTVYSNADIIMVDYQGTHYKRDYSGAFFYYFPIKYTVMNMINELTTLMGDLLTMFGSLIILAGLLLIVNIQLMSIEEREQQIGILRAIGTQRSQIVLTTIFETLLLGVVGSILGILGGVLYGTILVYAQGWAFDFPAEEIPIVLTTSTIYLSFIIGFMISLLTSVIPAMRASNINIVEVIRGISPMKTRKFGRKGLYFGLGLLLIGLVLAVISGLEPWQGQEAWRTLDDAEVLYFIILFPVVGIALTASYFFSKRWSLNILSFALLAWPLFNGFYITPEWIKEGGGGVYYIIGIALSLIAGSCIFIGVNLDYLAWAVQKSIGVIHRMKAIALLAMQQMAAKKVRSTLVFAIFSVVLTLNIFVSIWSYSWRYGTDELVELSAGGTDVIVISDQEIPESLGFTNLLHEKFMDTHDAQLVRGYSISDLTPVFLNQEDTYEDAKFSPLLVIDNTSYWENNAFNYDGWTFQFELAPVKHEEIEETDDYDNTKEQVRKENEKAWHLLADDFRIDGKPVIITPRLGGLDFTGGGGGLEPGDPIWLLNTTYQPVEFVVLAIHWGNALTDYSAAFAETEVPMAENTLFVSRTQAENLLPFKDGINTQSLFLIEVPSNKIRSDGNVELARDIESWANSINGDFRQTYGIYGIAAIPVWDVYEVELDGMYRFMSFMQIFTSGGFLVGLIGLLVVSMRSVQERKREIGMMRSLGFRKIQVTFAVLLELILMGIIGLGVGLLNGGILAWILVDVNSNGVAKYLIPWNVLALYTVIILSSAFIAAIIPGWLASRIPPSEALRYTG